MFSLFSISTAMLLLWTLGTSPHRGIPPDLSMSMYLEFPWFCWWSRGKIKWLSTFQNSWGGVDGQQTAGWCDSWSQALPGIQQGNIPGFYINKVPVIYIIFCLNTSLFGNILRVVNVSVRAVPVGLTEDWEGRGWLGGWGPLITCCTGGKKLP